MITFKLRQQTTMRLLLLLSTLFTHAQAQNASMPPAYSIPTIDLSEEINRQVIIDREKGQYLGH